MSENNHPNAYVSIYTAYGQLAGEMIRLLLESRGIPAYISQESAGLTYGLTIGRLGEVQVYVPAEKAEEAQKILQEMEEGKLEDADILDTGSPQTSYKNNKFSRDEIYKDPGRTDL